MTSDEQFTGLLSSFLVDCSSSSLSVGEGGTIWVNFINMLTHSF